MATPSPFPVIPLLPNPFTPMALLPPGLAYQVTISNYVFVGISAVLVWDILNNVGSDVRLIFKSKVGLPTWVYFASRVGCLCFSLLVTITATAPVGGEKCVTLVKAFCGFCVVAATMTPLLFFFRIRAVFDRNTVIVTAFALLWFTIVAGNMTVITAVSGSSLGPTKYCIVTDLKLYVSSAGVAALVYDTFVFLAISWRLASNGHANPVRAELKTFLFGKYLPHFSRALLQDGQVYYLATVFSNILEVVVLFHPSFPIAYRAMFTVSNVVLSNIMACRVFRNTKFGLYRESAISTSFMNATRDTGSRGEIPLSLRHGSGRSPEQSENIALENTVIIGKPVNSPHDYSTSASDKF